MHGVRSITYYTSHVHKQAIPYGRKFWRLADKIILLCHFWWTLLWWRLSQLAHNDIHNKMANRTCYHLTGPWAIASFGSVRMMKCDWKLDKSLLRLIDLECFRRVRLYSDRVRTRRLNRQLFPPPAYKLLGEMMSARDAAFNGELHADD